MFSSAINSQSNLHYYSINGSNNHQFNALYCIAQLLSRIDFQHFMVIQALADSSENDKKDSNFFQVCLYQNALWKMTKIQTFFLRCLSQNSLWKMTKIQTIFQLSCLYQNVTADLKLICDCKKIIVGYLINIFRRTL